MFLNQEVLYQKKKKEEERERKEKSKTAFFGDDENKSQLPSTILIFPDEFGTVVAVMAILNLISCFVFYSRC